MFVTLYELWLGQNNDPIYADEIFTPVGLITFLVALVLAAIFYMILGRWRSVFHGIGPWLLTLTLVLIFAFTYALWYSMDRTGADESDGYMTSFGSVNALYAVIYFFIFSIALKRFSIFAKHTPF